MSELALSAFEHEMRYLNSLRILSIYDYEKLLYQANQFLYENS